MDPVQGPLPADDVDDGRLFCYRHPDRETWVRCGRCDRPICTSCAMQGPVGFRCRECGRPARDPMGSFTPAQLLGGLAVSGGGGLLAAAISARFGLFALFVAFFAGGLIAQAITRVVGYKMGPTMDLLVYGGIIAGAAAAFGIMNADLISLFLAHGASAGASNGQSGVGGYLASEAFWAAIGAAVTCAGARTRMR
ncbi:MAG: B-box zinc finger protein [Candidatus Limnocylindrales bacterium]